MLDKLDFGKSEMILLFQSGFDSYHVVFQTIHALASDTMTNYTDAQNELATLLQQKYDLEAPTELTIQVALEQVQSEITATQTELDKIAEFDGKTYTAKAGVEQSEVDDLVNKISELENEQSQIMIYAGIDDESVLTSLETIQNFVIDDKGFNVTFDNYKTTRDRLVDVQNVLAGIKSKTIYVTTVTRTQSSRATGTAVVSGNAYESGSWGTPTDEKDALVGELGEELVVDPRTGTYHCIISELEPIQLSWLPWAFTATVVCDSPYGYTFPRKFSYSCVNETEIKLVSRSTINKLYYPKLDITLNGSNTISIINQSCNNAELRFENLPKDYFLTISVDNELGKIVSSDPTYVNMYQYCNFSWLPLKKGLNKLLVKGSCLLDFKCEFPVNFGG